MRSSLLGQRFGKLTVVAEAPDTKDRCRRWKCHCDCGKNKVVRAKNLRTGNTRSCGCIKLEQTRQMGVSNRKRPYEALYNRFKKLSPRTVLLTFEQFVKIAQEGSCYYCGAELRWAKHRLTKNGTAYNLDRKDNSKSYTVGNVVPCCRRCNLSKNNLFTFSEWVQIGRVIRSWRENVR